MNYVERFFDGVQSAIKINPATFSGAVDIVVVQQEDGSYRSTPWHVRFGKLQLLSSAEQKVRILVNDKPVKGIKMKLGAAGESYFVHESSEPIPQEIRGSPVSASPDASDTEVDFRAAEAGASGSHGDQTHPDAVRFGISDTMSDPGSARPALSGSSSPSSFITPVGSPTVDHAGDSGAGTGSAAAPPVAAPDHIQEKSSSGWGWGWGSSSRNSLRKSSSAEDVPTKTPSTPSIAHSETPAIPIGSVSTAHTSKLASSKRSNSFDGSTLGPLEEKPREAGTVKPGSWSSQVGSWFSIFKKDKHKDASAKPVDIEAGLNHVSPKKSTDALESSQEGPSPHDAVDDYDRNLADSPVSTAGPLSATGIMSGDDDGSDLEPDNPAEYLSGGEDEPAVESKKSPLPLFPHEATDGGVFMMDDLKSPPMSPFGKPKRENSKDSALSSPSPPTPAPIVAAPAAVVDNAAPPPMGSVAVTAPNQGTSILLPNDPIGDNAASVTSASSKCPEVPELAPLKELKIELSRCGNQIFDPNYDGDEVRTSQLFRENVVTFEYLLANPELLLTGDHDIVFRIENKLYPWSVAAPLMVSIFAFQRKLDTNTMDNLFAKFKAQTASKDKSWMSRFFSGLRRKEDKAGTLPASFSMSEKDKRATSMPGSAIAGAAMVASPSAPSLLVASGSGSGAKAVGADVPPASAPMEDDDDEDSGSGVDKNGNKVFYTKSITPSSEQLAQLGLKPGSNKITFVVNSKLQGKQEVTSSIYLWDQNVKIVVSDIDGTITKTDVFGQIFPVFGKDWSHIGVTELFSNIKANGYQILYLTARAIGASKVTKQYLASLQQESGHKLPDGPLFLAPDRLLHSLNREVILRKPEQFKITCLTQIKQLFPQNPFYAGFGNRHTDSVSYVAVGMSKSKIFIINPQSEIECASSSVRKTYKSINELVEQMFPPFHADSSGKSRDKAEEEFNDWNYWKTSSQYSLEDLEAEIVSSTKSLSSKLRSSSLSKSSLTASASSSASASEKKSAAATASDAKK